MPFIEVASLEEAIALAERGKAAGEYDWFRGQTRDWRPFRSALARLNGNERDRAIQRIEAFAGWIANVPTLAGLGADKIFAIAQHYGIPTHYVDFTTEPRVAGFFASHGVANHQDASQQSCILCVNTRDLAEFWDDYRGFKPDWPEPRRVVVDIPELWRLQAQCGSFLFLPYSDFERIYDFDRIYFPPKPDAALIPTEDIYPKHQSDLEILLDQYFMIERMNAGSRAIDEALGKNLYKIRVDAPADGIEPGYFGASGLPILASWQEAQSPAWQSPAAERWSEDSNSPTVNIEFHPGDDPKVHLAVLIAHFGAKLVQNPDLRKGPVKWECGSLDAVSRALRRYWNGMRRWPYPTDDLVHGLAVTAVYGAMVEQQPEAKNLPDVARVLADRCIGTTIEVEISMGDSSYTRSYANRDGLAAAVRPDFSSYLKEQYRGQVTAIQHIIQLAQIPSRVFDFRQLCQVFSHHIVPTQVILRGPQTGTAILYNVARADRLTLP